MLVYACILYLILLSITFLENFLNMFIFHFLQQHQQK